MKFGTVSKTSRLSGFFATNTINITTRETQMIYEKFRGFVSIKDIGTGAQMNICIQYGQMYIGRLFPFFNIQTVLFLGCERKPVFGYG